MNPLPSIIQNIHFVQLVSQKYVDVTEERMWQELERCSALLYVREQLRRSDPNRYMEAYHKGKDKLLDEKRYKLKYGAILDNLAVKAN